MSEKTVSKVFEKHDVEVEVKYEDGKVVKVDIRNDSMFGQFKNRSHIHGDHLNVVRELLKNGLPE